MRSILTPKKVFLSVLRTFQNFEFGGTCFDGCSEAYVRRHCQCLKGWNDHSNLLASTGKTSTEHFVQKRTQMLSNGHTIWDFGGNVSE
jgi:hypothetical protein